jgi:ATP-dependent Clp protease ATP-binding subunit ClpB
VTRGPAAEAPPISSELAAVVNSADGEARARDDDYVSTEHLLLALARTPARPATRCAARAPTTSGCSRR